jgi:hypothetical protein
MGKKKLRREGEEIWMTGGFGDADEMNGWCWAEGMVRRGG